MLPCRIDGIIISPIDDQGENIKLLSDNNVENEKKEILRTGFDPHIIVRGSVRNIN